MGFCLLNVDHLVYEERRVVSEGGQNDVDEALIRPL